jgi:glycosyl transferase family 2
LSVPTREGLLSIVMPVYNEAATVEEAIHEALGAELPIDSALVVVDDGSTGDTGSILDRMDLSERVTLLRHERNRGKGAAVRTGLAQAPGEFATILDADLEYDPADITTLLDPAQGGAHQRRLRGTRVRRLHEPLFPIVLGNRGVTLAANGLFNVYIKDLMTCHKAIRTEVFRALPLRESGFAIERPRSPRACSSAESGSSRSRCTTGRGPMRRGRSSRPWTGFACCARSRAAGSPGYHLSEPSLVVQGALVPAPGFNEPVLSCQWARGNGWVLPLARLALSPPRSGIMARTVIRDEEGAATGAGRPPKTEYPALLRDSIKHRTLFL